MKKINGKIFFSCLLLIFLLGVSNNYKADDVDGVYTPEVKSDLVIVTSEELD